MIPPVVPGQTEEQQNMVGWKNTFNMRQVTLANLSTYTGGRNGTIAHFMSGGCITSPAKSLDLLRRNLQNAINKDIDNVIRKYLEKFFQPAISNIKMNLGKNSVNEELLKSVCLQILEDAKAMYKVSLPSASSRDSSPYTYSDSEICNAVDTRVEQMSPVQYKRKESDTDSDTSCVTTHKHHKPHTKTSSENVHCKLPEKREGRKWDPDRITHDTLFIMGAKANKVLGFGQTRGRLYVRHPNVLRYPSDSEDKEWLAAHNLMPPSGGKAYLMLVEDVQELALSNDYRNNPNLQLQELCGFEAPPFMINKIKAFIDNVRTDKKQAGTEVYDYQQPPSFSYTTPLAEEIHTPDCTTNPPFILENYGQGQLCLSNTESSIDLTRSVETPSHIEPAVVEKFKRRRILDDLISTHGTTDNS